MVCNSGTKKLMLSWEDDPFGWRAKLVKFDDGHKQIEIRRVIRGADLLIIVNQNGQIYRKGYAGKIQKSDGDISISSNARMIMYHEDFLEMEKVIDEAIKTLVLDLDL